jgi:NAD(P)-dependent dehydrogenase (short-subunit alcohol dehydrogenase family)
MNSLAAKTALVTGASRGIGRAAAIALAQADAKILIHYGDSDSEREADAVVTRSVPLAARQKRSAPICVKPRDPNFSQGKFARLPAADWTSS